MFERTYGGSIIAASSSSLHVSTANSTNYALPDSLKSNTLISQWDARGYFNYVVDAPHPRIIGAFLGARAWHVCQLAR
jgi:hypothetical protein